MKVALQTSIVSETIFCLPCHLGVDKTLTFSAILGLIALRESMKNVSTSGAKRWTQIITIFAKVFSALFSLRAILGH